LRSGVGLGQFAEDGAVDGVDHGLGLDEFQPRPFRLVAVERGGQGFGKGVAVVRHPPARLFQRLKSFAHGDFAFHWDGRRSQVPFSAGV
jgi:hypothetical protein